MLEVLTYAALEADKELEKRLHIEPRIYGFTEAGHKVEFGIRREPSDGVEGDIPDPSVLLGFVECKKVGVEQTINQTFRRNHAGGGYSFADGTSVSFALGRADRQRSVVTSFSRLSPERFDVVVRVNDSEVLHETAITGHRIIYASTERDALLVIGQAGSLRDVKAPLTSCKILEFVQVRGNLLTLMLNDCLPGPQTPEKAKQASFVALDVRKKRFGQFDKRKDEQEMLSILVLTEFAHWEPKSRKMVSACLDEVVIVPDRVVIEAFEAFEKQFGEQFYDMITKEKYKADKKVKRIARDIIAGYDAKIFQRMTDGTDCAIVYRDGRLAVV